MLVSSVEKVKETLLSVSENFIHSLRKTSLLRIYVKKNLINHVSSTIELSNEVSKRAIEDYCSHNNLQDDNLLSEFLRVQGVSRDDFLHQVTLPYKLNKLSFEKFNNKSESYFLEKKEDFDEYVYMLIRVKKSDLAYELYLQIEAGENDFSTLAKIYSEGFEKHKNGLVGPTTLVNTNSTLRKKIETAKKGFLLEPFFIDKWWILLRLEDYIPAKLDERNRQKLSMQLLDNWFDKETTKLVNIINQKFSI